MPTMTEKNPPSDPGLALIAEAIVMLAGSNGEVAKSLDCICHQLRRFNDHFFAALDFNLTQIIQGAPPMGTINGVQQGGTGVFQGSLVPPNAAALQSGPTFTSDDSTITLTVSPTDPFNVTAAVPATNTNASFNLIMNGVNSAGNPITHTFAVPILQAPPPVAVDFDLNQTS